jgi:hypothetical protein
MTVDELRAFVARICRPVRHFPALDVSMWLIPSYPGDRLTRELLFGKSVWTPGLARLVPSHVISLQVTCDRLLNSFKDGQTRSFLGARLQSSHVSGQLCGMSQFDNYFTFTSTSTAPARPRPNDVHHVLLFHNQSFFKQRSRPKRRTTPHCSHPV